MESYSTVQQSVQAPNPTAAQALGVDANLVSASPSANSFLSMAVADAGGDLNVLRERLVSEAPRVGLVRVSEGW